MQYDSVLGQTAQIARVPVDIFPFVPGQHKRYVVNAFNSLLITKAKSAWMLWMNPRTWTGEKPNVYVICDRPPGIAEMPTTVAAKS